VGDSVPPTAVSVFSPTSGAGYLEGQLRLNDLAFTLGVRYDQFSAGSTLASVSRGSQR
jgi:outer membrane receptor protein involved in Fe transport